MLVLIIQHLIPCVYVFELEDFNLILFTKSYLSYKVQESCFPKR